YCNNDRCKRSLGTGSIRIQLQQKISLLGNIAAVLRLHMGSGGIERGGRKRRKEIAPEMGTGHVSNCFVRFTDSPSKKGFAASHQILHNWG
ncbi:hypothetical protein E2320_021892, partial [Naja naja]